MRSLLRSSDGFLLLMVIVTVMVLSVVIIGIMSLNVSRVTTAESVVDQIQAEEMAKGIFLRYHQAQYNEVSFDPTSNVASFNDNRFQVTAFGNAPATDPAYNEVVLNVESIL